MYFQDESMSLPALIPIKRQRKNNDQKNTNQRNFNENNAIYLLLKAFESQAQRKNNDTEIKQVKQKISPQKVQEIKKKYTNIQEKFPKHQQQNDQSTDKQRYYQNSKHMITNMMQKIDAKNIADELYPVTPDTILKNIQKMQRQAHKLTIQAQKKQNFLISNPNNQLLKKQLQILKVSIDRCITIKQLYNQKINFRNKISVLQRNIIQIKQENNNLKIQIKRQKQQEQNLLTKGTNNQKTLELKDSLLKCKIQLKKQKEMRQYFEANVNQLVMNFQRLYDEAEIARGIVIKKLKEVQEKQENYKFYKEQNDNQLNASYFHAANIKKTNNNNDNPAEVLRTSTLNPREYSQNLNLTNRQEKTYKKQPSYNNNPNELTKNKGRNYGNKTTLEQQITKMRNNQLPLSKSQIPK